MKFTASYDLTVKVITVLIFLLFSSIAFYSGYDIMKDSFDWSAILIHLIANMVSIGILAICYVYSPQYYRLNEDGISIIRIIKDRNIPLQEISEIRLLDALELRGIIRTFGVGGLFGYFGKFASRKLGTMTWFATQSKNQMLILLKTGEKIVITPDDKSLIELIQSKILK